MYSELLRSSVRDLYNSGLHPIPLYTKSKRPKGNEWQKQVRSPVADEQIALFGPTDNVGVICGDLVASGTGSFRHVCADIDKYNEELVGELAKLGLTEKEDIITSCVKKKSEAVTYTTRMNM